MKLASRISRISVSQTMAVNEKALQMRAQGVDIVDFGAGEPDFPTPENIKQAGSRAIECNFTRYTPIGGTPDLRKAIVEQHARIFGSNYRCFGVPRQCRRQARDLQHGLGDRGRW